MMRRIVNLARRLGPLLLIGLAGETAFLAYPVAWRLALGIETSEPLRGKQVAMRAGCFGCHGDGGHGKVSNLGGKDDVPGFRGGMAMMYAENDGEVREWILDGIPKRLRDDRDFQEARHKAALHMPAFRGKLSAREVEALVAYVKSVGSMRSPDPGTPAAEGFDVAFASGCFGCHGDAGMGGIGNLGSFKGYVPGWSGADYRELVTSDAELREWIENGRIHRLAEHPIAGHFVRGQVIQMPGFKDRLPPEKIEQLMAYVRWVQADGAKQDADGRR